MNKLQDDMIDIEKIERIMMRVDLPATNAQAFANENVKALVEAVKSAGHYAGMDLARISAALATLEKNDD